MKRTSLVGMIKYLDGKSICYSGDNCAMRAEKDIFLRLSEGSVSEAGGAYSLTVDFGVDQAIFYDS